MGFIKALAGPSRPLSSSMIVSTALRISPTIRHATSTAEGEEDAADEQVTAIRARKLEKAKWSTMDGYKNWLNTSGREFKDLRKGEKAVWLGGNFVYPIIYYLMNSPIPPIRLLDPLRHYHKHSRMSFTSK
jgi:hypothetical protein